MLPPLPEPAVPASGVILDSNGINGPLFTEAQLLDYRAAVVEACAKVCEAQVFNMVPLADCAREDCADAIRSMK
jgi:hypothetical protein